MKGKTAKERALTERQREVLREFTPGDWMKPRELGAHDASHHSATLKQLCRKGLVDKRDVGFGGHLRPAYVYRITEAGLRQARKESGE